ncbi:MAG: murein biosynthesis integral membrane protein MurJ, partial [Actinomycetota bacterium]|nr:murein biosynthesis integral membrane protein MurJ [Actinomycetota bacterium]
LTFGADDPLLLGVNVRHDSNQPRLAAARDYYSALVSDETTAGVPGVAPGSGHSGGRLARNTAIFAIATGVSRIVGLAREIVAASFFSTSGSYSAFTIASQIPNLMSNLFAQAALSAAFVPVFTELLQQGKKREAFRLASTLFWIILIALGAITAVLILGAGIIMPLFTGTLNASNTALTVGLTRVLFPVVLLLGLTGLLVGILQSFDEFSVAAIAPAVWNVVIVVLLVALRPSFHGGEQLYAYAIAWLAATVVQMMMVASALRRIDFRLQFSIDWHDPRVKQVFVLMLPVSIGLGIINLDQFLNSAFGALIPGGHAPAAINQAFRIYLLPQGMFSVAVATVLFPTLSRMASARDPASMRRAVGTGMRQINLLLVPAAALMIVMATPLVRLVYQHGTFGPGSTHLVSIALFWFAFSLPFAGINLLLTRTFFAVRRPWIPTKLAATNMVVDVIVSLALYKPLGIAGLVIGTAVANMVMMALQLERLRVGLNGRLEGSQTLMITARIVAASATMAAVAWIVWKGLDAVAGTSLVGQLISVGVSVALALYVYSRLVLALRIPEAREIERLMMGRLRPARG